MSKNKNNELMAYKKGEEKKKGLLAFDSGNGETKVIASFGDKIITFIMPSAYVFKSDLPLTDAVGTEVKYDEYSLLSEKNDNQYNRVYVWSENIDEHKKARTLRTTSDRYDRADFRIFVSMVISKVVEELGIKDEDVSFHVVSGVTSDEKGSKAEDSIIEAITNAPIINAKGEKFTPNVESVRVLTQPIGTIFNYITNGYGLIIKEIDGILRLVVDIGRGTSDVAKLNGDKIEQQFSIQLGVYDILSEISNEIRKEFGVAEPIPKINRTLLEAVKKGHEFNNYKIGKTNIDISDVFKKAITELTYKMKIEIETNIDNIYEVEEIILTGGGAPLFHETFKSNGFDMIEIKDSQFANVKGYYKAGLNLLSEN